MQISLFQICIRIRDISFSFKIEISAFKIEISAFQLQISVFKNKNRCLYWKHRYINSKYGYLYFKCRNLYFFKYRYVFQTWNRYISIYTEINSQWLPLLTQVHLFTYLFIREREKYKKQIFQVLCFVKWLELASFEHDFLCSSFSC